MPLLDSLFNYHDPVAALKRIGHYYRYFIALTSKCIHLLSLRLCYDVYIYAQPVMHVNLSK